MLRLEVCTYVLSHPEHFLNHCSYFLQNGEGENLQLLPPDLLQLYIQQLALNMAGEGGENGIIQQVSVTWTCLAVNTIHIWQQLVEVVTTIRFI